MYIEDETRIGVKYDHTGRTVSFIKDHIDQGVAFHNVRKGLFPALDLWFTAGSVEILPNRSPTLNEYL